MKNNNKNNLSKIRIEEGLTKTELANLAGVCTKVVSETERGIRNPKEETKYKIIKGLNKNSSTEKYSYSDIFPE